ncbi:MAG: thiamine pyrophosphate-dependent enzyme [Endomicrobiales bacterium]|jgi:indolepyruvate ferredoxin oxidoreductase alpha subunit
MKSKSTVLSGNEAIARGAFEAAATVGTGYPGTPSSEILESFVRYPGVYAEWSVNEKVAFEVAHGAALAGMRSLVTMKHVGVNVAADPLFTAVYTGVKAGLVLVSCDDPGMHSSQNEQDNRHYAYAAKLPVLEPTDSQEAKDFTKHAFDISERFDTPVMLRSTTRISHAKSVVVPGKRLLPRDPEGFTRNFKKYVMIPTHARLRRIALEERLGRLLLYSETMTGINTIEWGDAHTGFITSGICYQYVKEVFPHASILKIGMPFPFPEQVVRNFAKKIHTVYVVEELDPFIEMRVNALGIPCHGKNFFSNIGELSPDSIKDAFAIKSPSRQITSKIQLPPRYPALCPGCPHRNVFQTFNKLGLTVSGDIGCYALGVLPPFSALDTCIDMGASVTGAQGMELAVPKNKNNTIIAVIGDSTFAHSGITGLLNAAYNKRNSLVVVLDNGTTAMTGMQPNPLSGTTLTNEETVRLDYRKLAQAVGIGDDNFKQVSANNIADIEQAIVDLKKTSRLSLLIIKGKCIILSRKEAKSTPKL